MVISSLFLTLMLNKLDFHNFTTVDLESTHVGTVLCINLCTSNSFFVFFFSCDLWNSQDVNARYHFTKRKCIEYQLPARKLECKASLYLKRPVTFGRFGYGLVYEKIQIQEGASSGQVL
jgi:hypothetical protein